MTILQNQPDDLQLLSDAPAHHIFCLVPPVKDDDTKLPEVLCVIQVKANLRFVLLLLWLP